MVALVHTEWNPRFAGLRMNAQEFFRLPEDGHRYELIEGVTVAKAYPDSPEEAVPRYNGARMSAEEYLALADDGYRYELIDGVCVMSPSPTPHHQIVLGELFAQLHSFLKRKPVGVVIPDVDVKFMAMVVFRPDLVFFRGDRMKELPRVISIAPDMVSEVVSDSSAIRDPGEKLEEYERFGVEEYWLIDPRQMSARFFRLSRAKYTEVRPVRNRFKSRAVSGFTLDLARLWEAAGGRPGRRG